MSISSKSSNHLASSLLSIKSSFAEEFRRINVERHKVKQLEDFTNILAEFHCIKNSGLTFSYIDPKDGSLLPITNDDNLKKAIETARHHLRVMIAEEGQEYEGLPNGSNKLLGILSPFVSHSKSKLTISQPQNFRMVASIMTDYDVPAMHRRVRLLKHGEKDKPLGFYIRDGSSVRVTAEGIERVPGIFISRLVPGGLAESTGLLAVNDEVVQVNGIEVHGKTLDQVTDMMVANSSNLIITVKPANQRTIAHDPNRASFSRQSAMSSGSHQSHSAGSDHHSACSDDDHMDNDEIKDLMQPLDENSMEPEGIMHL